MADPRPTSYQLHALDPAAAFDGWPAAPGSSGLAVRLLRPYFMHHPELLGPLCSAAWETLRDLMAEAVCEKQGFRPGMLAVVRTFGDQLNLHPHVHALVTRGGWRASGQWIGVPYVD